MTTTDSTDSAVIEEFKSFCRREYPEVSQIETEGMDFTKAFPKSWAAWNAALTSEREKVKRLVEVVREQDLQLEAAGIRRTEAFDALLTELGEH